MTDKQIKDPCDKCDVEPPAMKFKCPECEHNPDKEQIIIDGVDISGCEFIDEWKHCDICNSLIKTVYLNATKCLTEQDLRCETYQNCHYKQLARKTQECEKLNDKIIDMNSIIEDAAINLGNKDFTLYNLPFEIKKLRQECEIWKNQVLVLDEESVTVQVTQEQFEEYQKLRQELNFARNEVHQKTEYIKEQRDIIDQLKQECEELKEKNALLESQMAFNLSEMEIRLGNEVNRSETLLKELKRFDKIKDEFREMSEKLKSENDRYRKALEEIEQVINNILNSCLGHETKGCTPVHNVCGDLIKILDIIDKAKGDGNE